MKYYVNHLSEHVDKIENHIYESKFPAFHVWYSGIKDLLILNTKLWDDSFDFSCKEKDFYSRTYFVKSKYISSDFLEDNLIQLKEKAIKENKDLIFYKYKKWNKINDTDSYNTKIVIRYCFVDREINE